MKTITNITYPAFALFAFACLALSQQARAICQEGCDIGNGNTFLGDDALINNTTGIANTALGSGALHSNTDGFVNVAIGFNALFSNTTGTFNTATGENALLSNVTGNSNTATGNHAMVSNTIGGGNTANGDSALYYNTDGSANTATGLAALESNTSGYGNTADGFFALGSSTTGNDNVANGYFALFSNTTGDGNTASGVQALFFNTNGNGNTASGGLALYLNTTGDNNTALGHNALSSNTTGSFNIALGAEAGGNLTTGSSNIDIANRGVAGEANTIRIGTREKHTNTFIAGINGATVPTGVAVIVDAHGHLGTTTSSARFKEAINPMDNASEAILALKPVTFRYKHELDPAGTPQFGLVAEEVAKVNPALVARDAEGKAYTVRYDAVNAMLLNEFLKEHRKNEGQEITTTELRSTVARQQKQIDALTAGLQKVSAQFELSKSAPQTVLNNQ